MHKFYKSDVLEFSTFKKAIMQDSDVTLPVPEAKEDADGASPFSPIHPFPAQRQAEDILIQEALKRTEGNQTMAAILLGITRQTLNRHLKKIKE